MTAEPALSLVGVRLHVCSLMPTKTATRLSKPTRAAPAKPGTSGRRVSKGVILNGKPDVSIFISYSHLDAASMERLRTHLAALMRDRVSVWFDGDLDAGDELKTGIARALREAQIFVALLSPDYLASNYCWNIEYRRAMNRRARGTMRVVAAVVRPCDWKSTRAAGFKLLPRDGRPVTRWRSADEAFLDIAEGIKGVVRSVRKEMMEPKPLAPKKAAEHAVPKVKVTARPLASKKAAAKPHKLPRAKRRRPSS